jgi:mannosyltransferase OCH1-like enzyme
MDTDFEVIKSLDNFLNHKCFLGFQRIEEKPGWVNNAIIGSIQGHDFLEKCMRRTTSVFTDTGEFILSPHVTTIILKEMGLSQYGFQTIENVTIYPVEFFYPYTWLQKYESSCITESTHAIHHWNMSWVEKNQF